MSSAFFISDVHLSRMASPSGEALLSLLKTAQKEAALFVILEISLIFGLGRESFSRRIQARNQCS